jgi:glycosyltransferase involved in cell wall biosynthesis
MKKIKVLFVIDRMSIGGAPSVVMAYLRGIDRTRFEPWLMTLYGSKAANFLEEARVLIGPEQVVEFRLWRRSPLDIVTLWRIFRFLRRERFDAVVTHLFLGNLIGRVLAAFSGVPRIVAFEHSEYSGKHFWQILADRTLATSTYRVVVANERMRDFTVTQEGIPPEKFAVIPNPLPPLPEKDEGLLASLRESWGIPGDGVIFVTIGRFSEEKGHEILIRAVALAAPRAPRIFVLILGHGALFARLKLLVAELGIENHCRVIEDPVRARNAYHLADAYVLPSLREGYSIGTAEAMIVGLPVIASDLPTVREHIENGVSGLLVPPGDAPALADALVELSEREEFRTQIGRESAKRGKLLKTESTIAAFEALIT